VKRETIKVKAASEKTHITLPVEGRSPTRITHEGEFIVPNSALIRRAIADGDLVDIDAPPAPTPEAKTEAVDAEAPTHEEG
jgi:hypothetical protein